MNEPAEVFPVAHFLQEEMDARGWSREDLLNRMPGDSAHNELWLDLIMVAPELDFETRCNLRLGDPAPLAHAFGTSAEFWTSLDDAYHRFVNTPPRIEGGGI